MKIKISLFYIAIYLLLLFFTLNFNYVEGDDANTILYHAMGRDVSFQPVYSAYHSMFDALLSLLNTENEIILRYFSISISFFCGLMFLVLLAQLILIKIPQDKNGSVFYALILLPFIVPELLFNSLIINPSLISISLILFSHILLLKYLKEDRFMFLVLSFILFGFGVSFRWINGFYLFVIFGDFILNENQKNKSLLSLNRIIKSFKVFPFYILSVMAFIWISGFSPLDILNTFNSATAYMDGSDLSYLSLGATSISFFTPAFLVLLVLGIFQSIIKKSYRELLWGLVVFIPFLAIGFYPSLKYLITTLLILFIIAINGFLLLNNKVLKFGMLFLIFVFWFVGIQIESNSTWGPGFELKNKKEGLNETGNFNPDNFLRMKSIKPLIGSGMAMPTLEGPRPIYGFWEVFMCRWNDFVNFHNLERKEAVNFSEENNCRILQDVRHAFIYSKLLELNYSTNDDYKKSVSGFYEREFVKHDSSMVVNVVQDKNMLFNKSIMGSFMKEKNKVVIYSSYSNIITKLKTVYKDKFEAKGVYWGVLR